MPDKVKIGGKEYTLDDFNENGKAQLASLDFTLKKIKELENMQALLQRAKNSYIESLKKEVLASKTGFFIEEDWEVRSNEINSADSQFFICYDSHPFLDGQYTAWGKVIQGMNLIDRIPAGKGQNGQVLSNPTKIITMRVK